MRSAQIVKLMMMMGDDDVIYYGFQILISETQTVTYKSMFKFTIPNKSKINHLNFRKVSVTREMPPGK